MHKTFPLRLLAQAAALAVMLFCSLPSRAGDQPIYPDPSTANADVAHAIRQASMTHKRVILDFGGNWCGDCKVLDIYFHDPANLALLDQNFILVHINVGNFDRNAALAQRYQIPLEKGVPALAVLDNRGRLLYSQRTGEFESMRRLDPGSVTSFLLQWKPEKR
ncbi:thioredoxin family protein [Acidicapsa dinghuensis]|uniref:Thioredoxin family protein n=1 Tax=Acidicapsa dinghuensis TaxID=2218256 RepID=A0ABW1EAX9_9BACT|nr:thioredoxin family protein [Acidicapsa dinghuensis]